MNKKAIVQLDRNEIFPCQICSRGFLDQDDQENHKAIYHHVYDKLKMIPQIVLEQLRAYECSKCFEKFYSLLAFRRHETMHFKEAQYWHFTMDPKKEKFVKPLERETCEVKVEPENNIYHGKVPQIDENTYDKNKEFNHGIVPKLERVSLDKELTMEDKPILQLYSNNLKNNPSDSTNTNLQTNRLKKRKSTSRKHTIDNCDDQYTCGQCPKSFKTLAAMFHHLASHSDDQSYSCGECSKSFSDLTLRNEHLKIHIDENKALDDQSHDNDNCSKSFPVQKKRNKYVETRSDELNEKDGSSFTSEKSSKFFSNNLKCDRSFTSEKYSKSSSNLTHRKVHLKNNTDENESKNDPSDNRGKCSKSKSSKLTQRKKHLKTESDDNLQNDLSYPCSKCPKSFSTTGKRDNHMKRHSDKYKVQCDICAKTIKGKNNLVIHFRVHTGERPYPCKYCDKRFTQSAALYTHTKIHLGIKKHVCSYCNKAFTEYHNMVNHERTHTKERPFKCQYCGRRFSDPSALKRHERTHTGDKIYPCQICHMKFSDASGLIAHKRRHAGIKKFECTFCDKKFFTSSEVNNHESSVHMQVKNLECDICKKQFTLKQYLRGHMERKHMKSVACEICATKFFSVDQLQKHILRGCIRDKYECNHCGDKFPLKLHVKKHMEEKHFVPLSCHICMKRFFSRFYLQNHKLKGGCTKRVHGKKKIVKAENEIKNVKVEK